MFTKTLTIAFVVAIASAQQFTVDATTKVATSNW
jgi:hypothetical protein